MDATLSSLYKGYRYPVEIISHCVCLYLPGNSLIRTGVDRILAHRNQDGGLPFIVSMTVFLTSLAGSALAASGADPALLRRMADYLANRQAPDGGWSYTEGVRQTDVDDTSCCVEFLNAVDPGLYHDVLGRARGFLTTIANNDGGFPTYLRGHASEVTMTANAVIALAPDWDASAPTLQRAVHFLLNAQKHDGTFERSWSQSNAYAIYRTIKALHQTSPRHHPFLRTDIDRVSASALSYLRRAQNPDGGWGHREGDLSDTISTAHALITVNRLADHHTRARGIDYLIAHQNSPGGFTSIPDQTAPRPIPYDFPVLADIFALTALAPLATPLSPAAPSHTAPSHAATARELSLDEKLTRQARRRIGQPVLAEYSRW